MIHLTGTNGKTSTSRMIDTLLRALDLRTGRFTSPHVERMSERISVDGEPLERRGVRGGVQRRRAVHRHRRRRGDAPAVVLRDDRRDGVREVRGGAGRRGRGRGRDGRLVGRHERRRRRGGGRAADRGRPHALPRRLARGDRDREGRDHQARRRRGAGRAAAGRGRGAARAGGRGRGERRCARAWTSAWSSRVPAVGGQVVSLQGLRARYDELFLPLYGAHQAQNAAIALAAVEAFVGGSEVLDDELVRAAFAEVTSPGRLEIVRTGPTILLDAAHNPHGAEAVAAALEDSFTLDPLIGVIGVMGGQGRRGAAGGVRAAPHARRLHPELHRARRCRPPSSPWSPSRCSARTGSPSSRGWPTPSTRRPGWPRPGPASALDRLRRRAGHRLGRHRRRGPVDAAPETVVSRATEPERSPRRGMCAAVLVAGGDDPRPDHAGDDQGRRRRHRDRARPWGSGSRSSCLLDRRDAAQRVGLRARLAGAARRHRPGLRDRP